MADIWGDVAGSLIATAGSLLGGAFSQKGQAKEADEARRYKTEQDALAFARAKELKMLGGGGGGGGGGAPVDNTTPLLNAYQGIINNNLAAGDRQSQAYQYLNNAILKALGG